MMCYSFTRALAKRYEPSNRNYRDLRLVILYGQTLAQPRRRYKRNCPTASVVRSPFNCKHHP